MQAKCTLVTSVPPSDLDLEVEEEEDAAVDRRVHLGHRTDYIL